MDKEINIGTILPGSKKIKLQIYVSPEIAKKTKDLMKKNQWSITAVYVYAFKKTFIDIEETNNTIILKP